MSMIKDFKKRVAHKYLRTLVKGSKTGRKIVSFNRIKTIGILYDASEPGTIDEVKAATKKLSVMGKEIYTLGYVDKKELPVNLEPHTKEDYYCRKDTHWFGLPIKERVLRFANEPFDYLLNVYSNDKLPLVGVSAISKAHCRLGTFNRKYLGCFDFMLKEQGYLSAIELLDAYILYLYKLKNDA